MKVCFHCLSPDVLPDHNVCVEHHAPLLCGKCRDKRRLGGVRIKPAPTSLFKKQCFAALAELGGRGTAGQIAALTGIPSTKVAGSLRSSKGVRYEPDPTKPAKATAGFWTLEADADSEPTAFVTSEVLDA